MFDSIFYILRETRCVIENWALKLGCVGFHIIHLKPPKIPNSWLSPGPYTLLKRTILLEREIVITLLYFNGYLFPIMTLLQNSWMNWLTVKVHVGGFLMKSRTKTKEPGHTGRSEEWQTVGWMLMMTLIRQNVSQLPKSLSTSGVLRVHSLPNRVFIFVKMFFSNHVRSLEYITHAGSWYIIDRELFVFNKELRIRTLYSENCLAYTCTMSC